MNLELIFGYLKLFFCHKDVDCFLDNMSFILWLDDSETLEYHVFCYKSDA